MDHQPKTREFVKSLGQFFKRDLISIPLIKKYPHQLIGQRCGLKAATLELDTAAYPNIEYIAGNRLSVYPVNPIEHVNVVMKHVIDDISPLISASQQQQQQQQRQQVGSATTTGSNQQATRPKVKRQQQQQPQSQQPKIKMSEPWAQFVLANGKDSIRLALAYLYDITTAPSRDLLRLMAESCHNREHKSKLIAISKSDDSWERWILQSLRTLKSTLEEFSSCSISAKSLFSELHLQQPRQYSISNIKSYMRFRTEIIVVQHKFNQKHMATSMQVIKERERMQQIEAMGSPGGVPRSPQAGIIGPLKMHPTTLHVHHEDNDNDNGNNDKNSSSTTAAPAGGISGHRSLRSVRSLRPMTAFGTSPISSQQVKRVPSYSGPLMSMYAMSSMNSSVKSRLSSGSLKGKSLTNAAAATAASRQLSSAAEKAAASAGSNSDSKTSSASAAAASLPYEGLCSNYLLNLRANDFIVCEFVENPRFTLKGNRERPIMMIGQDVGVFAFRTFWQQRILEHDRAQVFYTLFKDLSPKKFGDMQLVCLSGNKCKFEDLFKREIASTITHKILSSVTYIQRANLHTLLDSAATNSSLLSTSNEYPTSVTTLTTVAAAANANNANTTANMKLPIEAKELIELGNRIYKLLFESNGCIYTCCDPQMTQAIEILLVESIVRNNSSLARDKIMALLPKWKGRRLNEKPVTSTKFLFTLENPFERAQIVQEIYDSIN